MSRFMAELGLTPASRARLPDAGLAAGGVRMPTEIVIVSSDGNGHRSTRLIEGHGREMDQDADDRPDTP